MAMCIRVCQVGLGSPVVPYTPSLIILIHVLVEKDSAERDPRQQLLEKIILLLCRRSLGRVQGFALPRGVFLGLPWPESAVAQTF
jgi:hypothetical protein